MRRAPRVLAVLAVARRRRRTSAAGDARPARSVEESINSYDVQATVGSDGVLEVVETIQYDFGFTSHHGIYRTIPVRYPYDDTYERVLKVSDIHVSSDAPDDLETSNEGDDLGPEDRRPGHAPSRASTPTRSATPCAAP